MSHRTYRYFDGEVLYPFGYGLSYTSFNYGDVHIVNAASGNTVRVAAKVTNTGSMASDEVVQLYVSHADVKGAPIRSLQGFQRVHLNKGESKTVEFVLDDRALSVVDSAGKRQIIPGRIDLWLGGGQPSTKSGAVANGQHVQLQLSGSATLAE